MFGVVRHVVVACGSDVAALQARERGRPAVSDRPSEAALWASVADTLRRTVLPTLTDPQARQATIELIGLAIYARERGEDPSARRLDELAAALGAGAGQDVLRSCTAVLADPNHPASRAVRAILRNHLDEDLDTEAVLLEASEGRLGDG